MAKAKPKPDNNSDDIFEEKEVPVETFEVAVLSALRERPGFRYGQFDHVDVKYLFDDSYRINCYANNKIEESYFVHYSKHEGIYRCIPEV